MNSEIIELLEKKRNEVRSKILKKRVFVSKKERKILDKYDELLLDQYSKIID